MEKKIIMKCGHRANAEKDGKPYCAICDCDKKTSKGEVADVTGRKAKCWNCGKVKDSSYGLPFFEPRLKQEYDSFYCGCGGWN